MSVQNPERVVTKQDLADFYEQILPYLGGMPEILANKFSKGDMYSADEKMIGQWTDGKPLYQKTVNFGALPNNASKSVAHNISSISTVCNIYGIGVGSNIYQPFPILNDATPNKSVALWCDNTNVTVRATNEDYSAMVGYITIQYTKTTDSAVSIGNDTDYSTDEKIVGTWIDGRPIWQKTVSGTMPAAGSDTKISVSSDTIDFALTCKGTVPEYRTQPLSDYIGASIDKIFLIMTFFDTEEQQVYLRNTGVPAAQNKTAYVTVQYVKAT